MQFCTQLQQLGLGPSLRRNPNPNPSSNPNPNPNPTITITLTLTLIAGLREHAPEPHAGPNAHLTLPYP